MLAIVVLFTDQAGASGPAQNGEERLFERLSGQLNSTVKQHHTDPVAGFTISVPDGWTVVPVIHIKWGMFAGTKEQFIKKRHSSLRYVITNPLSKGGDIKSVSEGGRRKF